GSQKAFAAGADIKAMADKTYMQAYKENFITRDWESVANTRKPVIAAVDGYALGGGCELAMMCDIILASDKAKFGQPEVTIGTVPGMGGTQRLTKLVGKAKAMEMCLTGRMMSAQEAESAGLVSRVIANDDLLDEAKKIAQEIAAKSQPITMMIKSAINMAHEVPLSAGMAHERHLFHASFATADQKEGMAAFVEKRAPDFSHE
ncbi:MAG: enoyl-CoA hydratase-related protein, partial [Pseudomonadota bacterium]